MSEPTPEQMRCGRALYGPPALCTCGTCPAPNSYIVRNEHGAFCSVCQSQLGIEEDDWDVCDACGGEGIGGEDDDDFLCDGEE